jgi:hypothetical protein
MANSHLLSAPLLIRQQLHIPRPHQLCSFNPTRTAGQPLFTPEYGPTVIDLDEIN